METKLTDEMIEAQIKAAESQAEYINMKEPRAIRVDLDKKEPRIIIEFTNGSIFSFKPELVEYLSDLSLDDLSKVTLTPSGKGLSWEELDIDLSIIGLLMGSFGSKTWMQEMGRLGGKMISEKKAIAARINGKKGGRPKKINKIKTESNFSEGI